MVSWQFRQSVLHPSLFPLTLIILITIGSITVYANEEAIDDETCLACHEDQETVFVRGAHQLASLGGDVTSGIQCISCHQGGVEHIDDPSTENIKNPAHLSDLVARQACLGCHQPHLSLDNFGFNPHNEQQLNCASCHKVHSSNNKLLLSNDAIFCSNCHRAVETAFSRHSQHPVKQRNITCLSCHQFTKGADRSMRLDQLRICQDCHPEQAGPFPYEHPAAHAYMVAGGGCIECHEPHGSENSRLLKQPAENLCLQCHVTPPGHLDLPALHGFVRNVENCVACHSEIHGSFVSSRFLDPMLQARLGSSQPCADCHDLMR